jgi:hypothetical protein
MEIAFFIEIVLTFFTSYFDVETYATIKALKPIANNYIFNGSFIFDILAVIPYQFLINEPEDFYGERNTFRNVLLFRLLRVARIGSEFIPPKNVEELIGSFYVCNNKDD